MEDTMSGGHPEHRVLTTGLIGSGGARMSTSGGLINRDLEQMSNINDEITFFLQ